MASINMEANLEDAKKTVENLTDEIPKGADDAAERIAEEFVNAGKREMKETPRNEVTGEGLNSFKIRKLGAGNYTVFAATYLKALDKGRSPGRRPNTNNERFRAAARQYGIPVDTLAETIAQKGTEPYPWIKPSAKKIQRNAPKRIKIELNKAVKRSRGPL